MFNLLPQSQKKEAKREYHLRVLTVAFYLSGTALVAGGLLLAPSYVMVSLRIDAAEGAQQLLAGAKDDGDTPAAILAAVERDVRILNSLATPLTVEDTVSKALGIRPLGLTTTTIIYEEQGARGTLSVKGVAKSRNDLVAFVRALEAIPEFSNVELPISNLARNENIPFTLSLSVARFGTSTTENKP